MRSIAHPEMKAPAARPVMSRSGAALEQQLLDQVASPRRHAEHASRAEHRLARIVWTFPLVARLLAVRRTASAVLACRASIAEPGGVVERRVLGTASTG